MNIVFVGKSGVGKTTIRDILTDNLRYDKVITSTTRARRCGEYDGVDYNFISERKFDDSDMCCQTKILGYRYGIDKRDIDFQENRIVIVDKSGLLELRKNNRFRFVSIAIKSSVSDRFRRCIFRGDKPLAIIKRFLIDEIMFLNTKTDFVVYNYTHDPWDCAIDILKYIRGCD